MTLRPSLLLLGLAVLAAPVLPGCAASAPASTATTAPPKPRTPIEPFGRPDTESTTPPQLVPYVPGEDPAGDADYQRGIALYNDADFEAAAEVFSSVGYRTSAPRPLRRESLRYLGRTQIALGETAAANTTLRLLVELEPPIVELDPDVEPPPLIEAYYEVRRDFDGDYRVTTDRPQTLAVADFTNSSITMHDEMDPLSQGFASLMLHAMRGATDLRLVERERLKWLLDEQSLPTTDDAAEKAGKLLGADRVVFGFFIRNGQDMILGARVVDVETSEILLSERVQGKADRFSDLLEDLTTRVAQAINVDLASASVETNSLSAALSYSEGLALIETGNYQAAHAKFAQALEADPTYSRARIKAQSLQPLLAAR